MRDLSDENEIGFCYDIDRSLFLGWQVSDGPLVVAFDTNILIDLAERGRAVFDGDELPPEVLEPNRTHLVELARLLELWLTRDIRFVPLTRSLTDVGKGMSPERHALRSETMSKLRESLSFQSDSWEQGTTDPTDDAHVDLANAISASEIPPTADREMVQEACRLGVDVFLTQDDRLILRGRRLADGVPRIESPTSLMARLDRLGVSQLSGGRVAHKGCHYPPVDLLPSMNKWNGLLSALG